MPPEEQRLLVSDAAKRATEECPRDFACLTGTLTACKVEPCLGRELLVCLNKEYCSYQVRLAVGDYLCTCPVRKEIYKNYRI